MKHQLVGQSAILNESGRKQKMSHVAWDKSYIAQTVAKSSGFALYEGQKETRTICLRKVAVATIDNEHPTCPDCMSALLNPTDVGKEMEGYGKYFHHRPQLLQLFPKEFQDQVRPFMAAAELGMIK